MKESETDIIRACSSSWDSQWVSAEWWLEWAWGAKQ